MTGSLTARSYTPPQVRDRAAGTFTAQEFKDLFAHLPTGVTVLTTSAPDGTGQAGMTASAVCALSLDPPLILVCADNHSRTLARIRSTGAFAVNVLREDQTLLAKRFADPSLEQADRFACTDHHRVDDLPVLDEAVAWLTCDVHDAYPGGDHTILTASVRTLGQSGGHPLIWHNRTFRILA
ncbi:flavin reductase family protein [Streptomyces sp. NPDC060027]|uniref:flavin reductase family protein n=1 Tax=Streptomyces sp. NPDC060027 TaxID=3347040 RepID=UPI0036806954